MSRSVRVEVAAVLSFATTRLVREFALEHKVVEKPVIFERKRGTPVHHIGSDSGHVESRNEASCNLNHCDMAFVASVF